MCTTSTNSRKRLSSGSDPRHDIRVRISLEVPVRADDAITEHSKARLRQRRPLTGLMWFGAIFVLGTEIIRATVPSSGVAWAVTGVAGVVDVVVAGYLIHRVRHERRTTRTYQASSSENREILRWEISHAINNLDRRGQLRGSLDEHAAAVHAELVSREKSFAGKVLVEADGGPLGDPSSLRKHLR